jgi:hypothetical protein
MGLSWARQFNMTRRHIILGRDKGHLEAERDRWLSEHPDFELLREHPPKIEQSLLARIGGKNVPQVSIELEYAYRSQLV